MLGLGEEVRRHDPRVRRLVREYEQLTRTREHVDADPARHELFGRSHPAVARTHHGIADGHRPCAVGKRRENHRLESRSGINQGAGLFVLVRRAGSGTCGS